MIPRLALAVASIVTLASCEPASRGERIYRPEIDETVVDDHSPPSSIPLIPGIDSSPTTSIEYQSPGIDYNDGDELEGYGDDMFYICETLGEESDRCTEWDQHYGG